MGDEGKLFAMGNRARAVRRFFRDDSVYCAMFHRSLEKYNTLHMGVQAVKRGFV